MSILIVVTGGTFDKEYNELTGELYFKETHLKEMLILGRNLVNLRAHTLMMVDSLNMTEEERQQIVEYCIKAPEKQVIITHGTDTMVQTAELIAEQIKDKTIILTGAMIPYKFGSSDGLFNMGSALAFVQSLPSGVYVAMNGRYFDAHNVKKNRQNGVFEELLPKK